jgi:hypothetical protein
MPKEVALTVVRTGGVVMVQEPTETERWIAALLEDRAKYITAGLFHLIPGIDATLAHHGYEDELPAYETENKDGGQ